MSDPVLSACTRELEKLGAALPLAQLARNLGQRSLAGGGLAALGGAGGAAVGAVGGGIRGYQQRDPSSAGGAEALRGALRGASAGLGAGALLGGVGGMAGGQRAQGLVSSLSRPGAAQPGLLGRVARFGQRQAHSLTGALPAGHSSASAALESIGGGVAPLRQNLASLQAQAAKGGMTPQLQRQMASLGRGIEAGEKTVNMGMTSVPGLFKALATRPGEALTEAAKYQWNSAPTLSGKAMSLGLPAAMVGGEALRRGGPEEDGRGFRAGRALGEAALFSMGPMPIAGATAASGLFRGAANLAHKPFARKPGPPVPEDAGLSQPVEHVYSPSAQGVYPEGIGV